MVANAKGPRLPLVLYPTTSGTGSEVTPISIITQDDQEKKEFLPNHSSRLSYS